MRRATFFWYPAFATFLVIRVQKSTLMVIIFKNDMPGYMLCGRFEYFGSYFGNPGVIWGWMGVTEWLA